MEHLAHYHQPTTAFQTAQSPTTPYRNVNSIASFHNTIPMSPYVSPTVHPSVDRGGYIDPNSTAYQNGHSPYSNGYQNQYQDPNVYVDPHTGQEYYYQDYDPQYDHTQFQSKIDLTTKWVNQ